MKLNGKLVKKTCPKCGQPLVIRTNKQTETRFLGCSQYPICKFTAPLPQDLIMQAMEAQRLPGF